MRGMVGCRHLIVPEKNSSICCGQILIRQPDFTSHMLGRPATYDDVLNKLPGT